MFGAYGGTRVWRQPNKVYETGNTKPTVKHGGGCIMLWGYISSSGVGTMDFFDGICL